MSPDYSMPVVQSTAVEGAPDMAALPAAGAVVEIRDELWLVNSAEPTTDGFLVYVQGLSELVRDHCATFSSALDRVHLVDPGQAEVVADDSPNYRQARLWLAAMLRKSPVPLNDPELSVATAGLADPLGYQRAAVRKALDPDSLRPRLLLADAVGLGKTLEIGMILAELVRRGRGERILVVTPRHVLEQMQFELWTRFALPFVRLDSLGIQRIRQKLPANRNPFTYFKRVVISIDTLKSDRYYAHLRQQHWDAVVIDESHNVTNSTSQNNRLARLLSARTDALILASATPHNGRAESFAELIRMLDPSAVRPDGMVIEAEVERLIIRRHRHSPDVASVVGGDWALRHEPQNIVVPASAAEDAVAGELDRTWLYPEAGSPYSGGNSALFPWTLAKAFLSSPAALQETIRDRMRRLATDPTPAQQQEITALTTLAGLAEQAEQAPSGKYSALLDYLRRIQIGPRQTKRAVIFAERVATLRWLSRGLHADLGFKPEQVRVLHGGLSDIEQQEIVESFKQESSPIRILVTGDVASEGVNLHSQCHELIHFDIPWSLIRIEQRNGRIDRYGQKFRPQITTLLLTPTSPRFAGDIRILAKLMDKEHQAHQALGDSASLMGKYDVAAEEDAIREVLSGQRDLDQALKSVTEVRDGGGIAGLFARLSAQAAPEPQPSSESSPTAGVFDSEIEFFREAVAQVMLTPAAAPPNGVSWREFPAHSMVEFAPPADLQQRLAVLPQSYLAARRVTQSMKLATTTHRGRAELAQALADESSSLWPEAHFLAPLHPVMEWASDRALASLGRSQIFAVRGEVDFVSILLQGLLSNRRGQVVASSLLIAEFPNPASLDFCPVKPVSGISQALQLLGFSGTPLNSGAIPQAHELRRFIPPAMKTGLEQLKVHSAAAWTDAAQRVARWSARAESWDDEVGGLIQRSAARDQRERVRREQELAQSMSPQGQVLRPLLVVIPQGTEVAELFG